MGERTKIELPQDRLKEILGKGYDENIFLVPPLYKQGEDTYSMKLYVVPENRFVYDRTIPHLPMAAALEAWAQLTRVVYGFERPVKGKPLIPEASIKCRKEITDFNNLEVLIRILQERPTKQGLYGKLKGEIYDNGEKVWWGTGSYAFLKENR